MVRRISLVILSASMMALSLAQTFQYSRGWTNGKRGGGGVNPSQYLADGLPIDFGSSLFGAQQQQQQQQQQQASGNPIVEMPTPCQIKKIKLFLRGTAGADQLYLMPCEILENGSGSPSMQSDLPSNGHYRRSSPSLSQGNDKSY